MDVSVVIPLYNKAAHIARALDSVLKQSLPPREIIVVDDGSTDEGALAVSRYVDKRVRLIRQENRGVSAARNRGISEARTDLIAFLDADDEWMPEFLKEIEGLKMNYPGCGVYATSGVTIRSDLSVSHPGLEGAPTPSGTGILPSFFGAFQSGWLFYSSSFAAPKAILDEVHGFPEGVVLSEDVDCWVRIALGYPIAFSSARLFVYHQEAENRSYVRNLALQEHGFVKTVRDALNAGAIPQGQRNDAMEFIAFHQMAVASNNLMAGNPRNARLLLRSCRNTAKHARTWRMLMMLAMLPSGWPAQLMAARIMMGNLGGRRR
jgi:glycosyltransferase involved in cell wall biosynthesis